MMPLGLFLQPLICETISLNSEMSRKSKMDLLNWNTIMEKKLSRKIYVFLQMLYKQENTNNT